MTAIAGAFQRHQRVDLRVVRRSLPGGYVKGQQGKVFHPTLMLVVPDRNDVDLLPRLEAQADDVGFIDEQYVPLALDPAIAVIEAIDGGVVLIVRAHRLQDQVR